MVLSVGIMARANGLDAERAEAVAELTALADTTRTALQRMLAAWLPQPAAYAELARDRQHEVEGSTLEMYWTALAFRRAFALAVGSIVGLTFSSHLLARIGSAATIRTCLVAMGFGMMGAHLNVSKITTL